MPPGFWIDLRDFVVAILPVMAGLAVVILLADWRWRRRSGG
jgi:hypothetical protein